MSRDLFPLPKKEVAGVDGSRMYGSTLWYTRIVFPVQLFHDAHVHMWPPQYHKTDVLGFGAHE